MKNVWKFIFIVGLSVLCGCATRGRVTLVDFDFRSPEQIVAYRDEARAPYIEPQNQNNKAEIQTAAVPTIAWWQIFMDVFKSVKGRVRLGVCEWEK